MNEREQEKVALQAQEDAEDAEFRRQARDGSLDDLRQRVAALERMLNQNTSSIVRGMERLRELEKLQQDANVSRKGSGSPTRPAPLPWLRATPNTVNLCGLDAALLRAAAEEAPDLTSKQLRRLLYLADVAETSGTRSEHE